MKLVRLNAYSGSACSIYTILDDDQKTRYEKFLNENYLTFEDKLIDINGRIISIGKTGALEGFFKLNEWRNDERICCLYDDPDTDLRLFCIRFESEKVLVLGGGGPKPKNIRAWQDDSKLKRESELIILVSDILRKKIAQGLIFFSKDDLRRDLHIP